MTDPGAAGINAIGVIFFVLAGAVTRYAPKYSEDVSEFWRAFSTALGVGAGVALIRTVRGLGYLETPLRVFDIFFTVLLSIALMAAGLLWSVTMAVDAD